MSTILSYKAKCSMSLITVTGTEYKISPAYIKAISTDYKFKANIMPILYAILDVDQYIYQKLLDNATDGSINLRIVNYNANADSGLEKEVCNEQFIYFVPTKYNYEKEIVGVDVDELGDTPHIVLGLIKASMIYDNKFSFNGIYTKTTTEKILKKFLKGLPNLVMDELEYDEEYESFLLPPQQTRSNAIDYLFNKNPFYSTKYMFFMDFKNTYLLNTSGDARNTAKSTILFQIENINARSAYYTGISKDMDNGTYVIYVNQSDVNVSINTTTDKTYNQLVSTYTDMVTTVDSNIVTYTKDTTNKQDFSRANAMATDIRKQIMDNTAVVINLTKMNLDSSLITPDKSFVIDYANYSAYNGKYLLIYKKEIIVRTGDNFNTTTIIGLERVATQESSTTSARMNDLYMEGKSKTKAVIKS